MRSTRLASRSIARQRAQRGGLRPRRRYLARRTHQQDPRADQCRRTTACPAHLTREHQRHDYGTGVDRGSTRPLRQAHRRQRLRQQRHPRCHRQIRRRGRYTDNPQPQGPIPYNRDAYRARNLVERLWCRLKDWRRIASRYDKLVANYMAAVFLAATITFRCN